MQYLICNLVAKTKAIPLECTQLLIARKILSMTYLKNGSLVALVASILALAPLSLSADTKIETPKVEQHDHADTKDQAPKSETTKDKRHHEGHDHEGHEEHGAHEHGKAQLSIAIDGNIIEAIFQSPMANIVGFEYEPKSDEERQKIKTVQEPLIQGTPLFNFNSEANCKLSKANLESAVFADATATTTESNNSSETDKPKDYKDLTATWTYECAEPSKLTGADIKLFSVFSTGLEQLKVEWITDKGANARDLTKDETITF